MKRFLAILGVTVLLFATIPGALADSIVQADPGTITCRLCADFEDVPAPSAPGTNYDDILESGGLSFAERFTGQALSYQGRYDVLSGSPDNPLSLQVGLPNQNVDVLNHTYMGANVVSGLGPLGYPDFYSIGEGSVAVLFPTSQAAVKFTTVGTGGSGNATISFFRSDGSPLGTIVLDDPANQVYGFRTISGNREITGFSIHNTDPAGMGYDTICYSPLFITVDVDIKPGGDPNTINLKSKGLVPVAILTTGDFDAADVIPGTVTLEGIAPVKWTMDDVPEWDAVLMTYRGDGDLDLLLHFPTRDLATVLTTSSTGATLEGETFDGVPVQGTDTVHIIKK